MKRFKKSNLHKFALVSVAVIPATFCSSLQAAILRVDINVPPGCAGNGTTWSDAFKYLPDALSLAVVEDQVWVAQGIYYPDECATCGPGGTDIQDVAFDIPLEVKVFGGFPTGGGDGTFEARDPDLFDDTILSGDIDSNDTNSPAQNPGDINGLNSFHVVTIINENSPDPKFFLTEVDGFMITAGNATHTGLGDNETGGGGGAFIIDKDPPLIPDNAIRQGPLFRNCIFQGNRAERAGGAIAALRQLEIDNS